MTELKFYKDFPKPGITFVDMNEYFSHSENLHGIVDHIMENVPAFDCVLGIESRGFVVASICAYAADATLVMVRKPGKLPGDTIKATYEKEYGEDAIEMQTMDLTGKKVLIVDDLLATGGTLRAAVELCKKCGCRAEDIVCHAPVELTFLHGREILEQTGAKVVTMKRLDK